MSIRHVTVAAAAADLVKSWNGPSDSAAVAERAVARGAGAGRIP